MGSETYNRKQIVRKRCNKIVQSGRRNDGNCVRCRRCNGNTKPMGKRYKWECEPAHTSHTLRKKKKQFNETIRRNRKQVANSFFDGIDEATQKTKWNWKYSEGVTIDAQMAWCGWLLASWARTNAIMSARQYRSINQNLCDLCWCAHKNRWVYVWSGRSHDSWPICIYVHRRD